MASLLAVPCRASALFISAGSTQRRGATQRRGLRIACASSPKSGSGKGESASAKTSSAADAEAPNPGAGLKAVWMGAEAFGNVVGALKSSKKQGQLRQQEASKLDGPSLAEQQAGAALKREQALALIREDFIQNYFVTGMTASSPVYDLLMPASSFSYARPACSLQARVHWRHTTRTASLPTPLPPSTAPPASSAMSATWAASCEPSPPS